MDAFVRWFQSNGGHVDAQAMGITEFPGSGRGAIALCDIPKGHTLFTIPRTITLSTRTSPLPSLFGLDAWRAHGLHKGWVGLILCMMWEDAWEHESHELDAPRPTKWGPYLRTLPEIFDTPMFWSAEELEELRGTAVMEKIGRDDAERAYSEKLIPAVKTSPSLFPPSHHEKWYTLDAYHRAGSRILSRSFIVSRWTGDDEMEEDENHDDESKEEGGDPDIEDTMVSSSEHDEEDDPSDVAMVPMADVLNARWGSENAKLFYEPLVLRMVSTRNIQRGEQIFNTYGDPPNSELLRRYGHVDLVRLPPSIPAPPSDGRGDVEMNGDTDATTTLNTGNPSDVVELRADLVVQVVQTFISGSKVEDMHARIEWWLDEGEDDVFVLGLPEHGSRSSAILPSSLVSLVRLLALSKPDFENARSKGRLPKGKLKKDDVDNKAVVEMLDEVFKQRQGMYVGGSVEDDEQRLLSLSQTLSWRKRHAVIVRVGEKRILRDVRGALKVMLSEFGYAVPRSGNETDRARGGGRGGNSDACNERKRGVSAGGGFAEGGRGSKKARK